MQHVTNNNRLNFVESLFWNGRRRYENEHTLSVLPALDITYNVDCRSDGRETITPNVISTSLNWNNKVFTSRDGYKEAIKCTGCSNESAGEVTTHYVNHYYQ